MTGGRLAACRAAFELVFEHIISLCLGDLSTGNMSVSTSVPAITEIWVEEQFITQWQNNSEKVPVNADTDNRGTIPVQRSKSAGIPRHSQDMCPQLRQNSKEIKKGNFRSDQPRAVSY